MCGYFAHATERIHIGSGIFNPLPQVNHPAKVAERVATLDHITNRRFEFGTGRGAGSHEILGFLPEGRRHRHDHHQGDLGGDDPRVRQDVAPGRRTRASTASAGRCRPARSSPSPTARATRRCGTPPATRRATRWPPARASACSASRSARSPSSSRCSRPTRTAIVDAEPIGAFVNDNLMVTASGVRRPRTAGSRSSAPRLRDDLPPEQRVPLPRHVPAPRGRALLARADPAERRPRRLQYQIDGGLIVRRPRPGDRPVPARGSRPAPTSWCSA